MEKKGIFTFFLYSFFIFSCLYAKICFQAPLVAFLCRYFDTVSVELHLTSYVQSKWLSEPKRTSLA